MKKTTKPAAKAATKPATKRPRTYKKADLPRTARAYLGKVYSLHMGKENEAVARLIELHEERTKELQNLREYHYAEVQAQREADFAVLRDLQPKQLTLREKFLAWIGAK
jgi:hypothetical protein